jgi:hypothetical protein
MFLVYQKITMMSLQPDELSAPKSDAQINIIDGGQVIDCSSRVLGNRAHKGLLDVFPITVQNMVNRIKTFDHTIRMNIKILLLNDNPISEMDFLEFKDLLELYLPNVNELDLSYCSLDSATSDDIKILTKIPQLKYVIISGTVLAGPIGYKSREGLDDDDFKKLIFMTRSMTINGGASSPKKFVELINKTHCDFYFLS